MPESMSFHSCCRTDWTELDGSINIHLVLFIGLFSSHITKHISHLFIFIVNVFFFLLWICQCQILSLGTEVVEHGF